MDFVPSQEIHRDEISLYKGLRHDVHIPNPPRIPIDEGLNVEISGQHDTRDRPKEVLQRLLLGLGSAKAIAESGATPPDFWANTRIDSDQTVSAFGRVPTSESSWRKPVDTNGEAIAPITDLQPHYDQKNLGRLFSKYIPQWEKLSKQMSLFNTGVGGVDHEVNGQNVFDQPVWSNDNFTVKIMQQADPLTKPWLHLNGHHLVIAPTEKYQRQWQTITETTDTVEQGKMIQTYIQQTLEAGAISLGVQKLLAEGQGEIHNSGNWAPGLKAVAEEDPKGKLDMANAQENPKEEKRKHFTRITLDDQGNPVKSESDFNTATHFHVYIPFEGDAVKLPSMWPWEAQGLLENAQKSGTSTAPYEAIINQWKDIKPLTEEQIKAVGDKLGNGKLSTWLTEHCQGQLDS